MPLVCAQLEAEVKRRLCGVGERGANNAKVSALVLAPSSPRPPHATLTLPHVLP